MFNILNPIHYIAVNNPKETIDLLVGKYELAEPQSWDDLETSIDLATQQYGKAFIDDMVHLHPDKPQIIIATGLQANQLNYSNMIEGDYKKTLASYTVDQLQSEVTKLNTQLLNIGTDETMRADVLEKIKYAQEILVQKLSSSNQPAGASAQNGLFDNIHKTNKYLLLGLTAFALIMLGSQIKISRS